MLNEQPSVVIIVSAGRSGSRFVRDLLAASRCVAAIPFDVNHVWRHGHEWHPDDALARGDLTPAQGQWIRRRILRLAGWRAGSTRRILVEKSVSNSLRVDYVRGVFPKAKLIHLVRDGRAVVESARRVWNERPNWRYSLRKLAYVHPGAFTYLARYARDLLRTGTSAQSRRSWGPRYPGMDSDLATKPLLEVCVRQWLECTTRADTVIAREATEQAIRIRFEDLLASRDVVMDLCRFAGIQDAEIVESAWRQRRDMSNIDKWRERLTRAEIAQLTKWMLPELHRFGYEA